MTDWKTATDTEIRHPLIRAGIDMFHAARMGEGREEIADYARTAAGKACTDAAYCRRFIAVMSDAVPETLPDQVVQTLATGLFVDQANRLMADKLDEFLNAPDPEDYLD